MYVRWCFRSLHSQKANLHTNVDVEIVIYIFCFRAVVSSFKPVGPMWGKDKLQMKHFTAFTKECLKNRVGQAHHGPLAIYSSVFTFPESKKVITKTKINLLLSSD